MTIEDYKWETTEFGTFPAGFAENTQRIIAQQYFRKGETHFWDTCRRIVKEIAYAGRGMNYFGTSEHEAAFVDRLMDGLINQRFAFNSPVWYNLGVNKDPQCSACFIQPVEDSMESIMDLAKKEAILFKSGSGTGTNLSPLRSSKEKLSKSDGLASGPVSFMRGYDAFAGVVKSGGRTRRAAKMQVLNDSHPDLLEFIRCKEIEGRKAKSLIKSGYTAEDAYGTVAFQNANLSVRLSDKFMQAKDEAPWLDYLGNEIGTVAEIKLAIARAAWACGDPGVQFTDTINRFNTVASAGRINASNPCSEFLFLDDSACNLASLNLMKYTGPDDPHYRFDILTLIVAMDIIVGLSGYPSKEIEQNSRDYRPLGLGFTNLGAYLVHKKMRYGSTSSFRIAADMAKKMYECAIEASSELARKFGPHKDYDAVAMKAILEKQLGYLPHHVAANGLRNAQLTLLAPTGTISFLMGCDSTGIEPVYSDLMKKKLASGETITITPKCFVDAPDGIKVTAVGERRVTARQHLQMMAAVQPFLSGGISKTVNLPVTATVDEVWKVYRVAHAYGIKSVALYRDGSHGAQPLATRTDEERDATREAGEPTQQEVREVISRVVSKDTLGIFKKYDSRKRLPDRRNSVTHKFNVGGHVGYLIVGLYEDGRPGELFVNISKAGSSISGWADSWSILFSMALQYGVPLEKLVKKYRGAKFEPSGFTGGKDVRTATSIVDYVAQWMEKEFLPANEEPDPKVELSITDATDAGGKPGDVLPNTAGEECPICSATTQRTGSCTACSECGWTGGCG